MSTVVNGTLGNVRGLPPVEEEGQFVKSTISGAEWAQITAADVEGLPAVFTLPPRLAPGNNVNEIAGDFNLANESGWWFGRTDDLNTPNAGANFHVAVTAHSTEYVSQMAFEMGGSQVFFRASTPGVWSTWVQIYPHPAGYTLPVRLADNVAANAMSDANQGVANGFWYAGPSTINTPRVGENWYIQAYSHTGSAYIVKQIAYMYYGDEIWQRWLSYTGAWSAWVQVYPITDANLPKRLRSDGVATGDTYVSDLNACTANGFYAAHSSTANKPGSQYGAVIVVAMGNMTYDLVQTFYEYQSGNTYERRRWDTTWGAWVQTKPVATVLPTRLMGATQAGGASITDWNNANEAGFYDGGPGTANSPDSSTWWIGTVNVHRGLASPRYISQEVWEMTGGSRRYRRQCIADTWGAWTLVSSDSGWANLSLASGWGNVAYPWGYAQVRQKDGLVTMQGLIGHGDVYTSADELMFTLPTWARPAYLNLIFMCPVAAPGFGYTRVDVHPNGTVTYGGGSAPVNWVSLAPITFSVL